MWAKRVHFLLVLWAWLFTPCIGDATNLVIINLTPYALIQSKEPHSYQMESWDNAFPESVNSHALRSAHIQLSVGVFLEEADDAGEAYYRLDDGTNNQIQIALEVSGSITSYNIHLNANFDGISTLGNPNTAPIGFRDNGNEDPQTWTPFILAGDKDKGYIGNNPPQAWMQNLLPYIGCRTLQRLTLPGTHNSGMSLVRYSTAGSWASNTMTQETNILEQLKAGARYLDIRPVISHADYYTGHYTKTDDFGWQGSAGESIDEIIDEINEFTKSNAELIILHLTHSANTDTDYSPFDEGEWESLLYKLYSNLNYLYEADSDAVLTRITLETFISSGPAVVVVVDEASKSFLFDKGYTTRGFFDKTAFPLRGSNANDDRLDVIRRDQYNKLQSFNQNRQDDEIFVLSWIITMYGGNNVNPLDHITTRANILNNHLAEGSNNVPYNSPFLWADSKGQPSIIMVDNIKTDRHLVSLAAAYNVYYQEC
ncbi:hypothetical protein B0A52_09604 [Exophiala mesophila]|uniref:Phosphatidylinositol-specific phospholipase C X domain-containing protein n=1 Tax=Exophiala mesophila TaxID=212818 RepID=A0A438MT63_EXOME|nr:hypothetical protein B0A52_09604 [Exophiala mesophila]